MLYNYSGLINSVEVFGLQNYTFTQLPESETLVFVILKESIVSADESLNAEVDFQWKVSPNPASDVVSVTYQGNPILLNNNTLQIKDITGKLILEKSLNKVDFTIDVSTFQTGVYLMTIGNSEVKTCIKMVKI